ncbi:MAG: transcription-repair coupling factor [Bdellovibrionia bacterium]
MNSTSSLAAMIESALHSKTSSGIRILGSNAPAQAFFVAHYAQALTQKTHLRPQNSPACLVVLCATSDQLEEFTSNFQTLAQAVSSEPPLLRSFPTWEKSPYGSIALSLQSRLIRLATLHSLLHSTQPQIIATTWAAACQSTLPRDLFVQHTLALSCGASLTREALVTQLGAAGYLRVDPVEDPGTFCIRGDILDVFSVDREKPLRIELFDDVVDRIREFDPATQRTLPSSKPLESVFIPPAREVLIHSQNSDFLREKIKQRADDQGIPRLARDPILDSIKSGIYPEKSDGWAPFAYEKPGRLWDYLSDSFELMVSDPWSCQEEWVKFIEAQEGLAKKALEKKIILPQVSELFHDSGDWEKLTSTHTRISFESLDLLQSECKTQKAQEPGLRMNLKPLLQTLRSSLSPHSHTDSASLEPIPPPAPSFSDSSQPPSWDTLEPCFRAWLKDGYQILLTAPTESQLQRIRYLLEQRNLSCVTQQPASPGQITLLPGLLSESVHWPEEKLAVITESDLLGTRRPKKTPHRSSSKNPSPSQSWNSIQALSDLNLGDRVVHVEHGVGCYQGICRLHLQGALSDFLLLEYANQDRLYIPIYRLNAIQKYVGAGDSAPLDQLGSARFKKIKDQVKEEVKKLAFSLIDLYAKRKLQKGIIFPPNDRELREFEAQFPYDETPDQLQAIQDVMNDLESGQVMDRLVCGDVGYGKTEVGIRAAFKAVSAGKQVAVLVPTTILAQQHQISFQERMKDYPILIESLCRFRSKKEQKTILEAVSLGKIDIVIGTHRLLSQDVQFQDLGLIIVDEEHRFGVEHKERLKTLKLNTHVLTLTATPIPRTLHMALSGIREISLIKTPPVNRLPIHTYVSQWDENVIRNAIEFELSRGGQVFYLHNRVQTIQKTARRIHELVPQAKISVAHGQMNESELEKTMFEFYEKKSNVLVCTTLIESGIDLPSANTILIERADQLGLAQLYQIRGRVGRSQQRAYAYLLIPEQGAISEDAIKRLEVIQKFIELGSGFQVASHDLEIRGGGDLLGAQQSGNINAVGFDLYTELLEEAIQEIKGQPEESHSSLDPEIKTPFPCYLSEEYVPDIHSRLSLYRRLSAFNTEQPLEDLEQELRERFGSPPPEAQNLLWLIRIKILLKKTGIEALTVGPEKISLTPGKQNTFNPTRIIAMVSAYPHEYQLLPDSRLIAKMPTPSLRDLFFQLETCFKKFI